MPPLRQIAATIAAVGTLSTGCVIAGASAPIDAGLIASPPTTCHVTHYGYEMTCQTADALRVGFTMRWLRHYAVLIAAARYATAVYRAQQAQSSIHDHPWLTCIRARESGGNYRIYNSSGSGASGAYQFMAGTWAWMSAEAGYGAYSGAPAASAPPGVQDAVAYWAYTHGYASHWVTAGPGGC